MKQLVETYRGVVYPWHCDHMNHMNVMWYVGKFDEATWELFRRVGVTPSFLRDNHRGMAALDQRIGYQREMRAGDLLAIRSGVLEVREKTIRFVHEMRNSETQEVSAVTCLLAVHLDTDARKSAPLPRAVAPAARGLGVDDARPG